MSGTVHLVSGRDLPGRPTLCAALRRCASRRAERIVSVGAGVPGSVATIPMPADRIGLAAPVFEAWARRHMKSDDAIVAWDTPAMCVAAETGYRVVAVLDGVHRAGAVARCATVLVRSGDVQLCGASVTTSRRLGSAESGTCGPLLPPEMSPLHEKDGLRVSIAAEPAGMGTMLPLIGIFGRLHLLGMALSIHIAGAPADAAHGTAMLAAIGITNVTVGSMAGVPRQSGEVVFLPVALGVSGTAAAVAPAIMMWSRGADVLLPEAHAACSMLAGRGGVMVMRAGHTGEVVRWIAGSRDRNVQARLEVVEAWRSDADRALDACIGAAATATSE